MKQWALLWQENFWQEDLISPKGPYHNFPANNLSAFFAFYSTFGSAMYTAIDLNGKV